MLYGPMYTLQNCCVWKKEQWSWSLYLAEGDMLSELSRRYFLLVKICEKSKCNKIESFVSRLLILMKNICFINMHQDFLSIIAYNVKSTRVFDTSVDD